MCAPDGGDFEEIYRNVPVGLTIVACKHDHCETLRSFCYSLKGAAMRLGSNAMFFVTNWSNGTWRRKGISPLRNFVEKHKARGVRMFLVDQPTVWIDTEIIRLIQEVPEEFQVSVILTAVADSIDPDGEKPLAVLASGAIQVATEARIMLRGRSTTVLKRNEFPVGASTDQTVKVQITQFQTELQRDAYFATTCFGGIVQQYGPLRFADRTPGLPSNESSTPTPSDILRNSVTAKILTLISKLLQRRFFSLAVTPGLGSNYTIGSMSRIRWLLS